MNTDQKQTDLKSEIHTSDSAFDKMTDEEKIDFVAARVLKTYRSAFEELAK